MRSHFRQKYNKPIPAASTSITFNDSVNKVTQTESAPKRIKAVQIDANSMNVQNMINFLY